MADSREQTKFERELIEIINKNSVENGSDTPDFLLGEYLYACLQTWNWIIKKRENWYGRECGDGISITGLAKLK